MPETLVSGPLPGHPDTHSVTVAVTLSGFRETTRLAQRFAAWPRVTRVLTLSTIESGSG